MQYRISDALRKIGVMAAVLFLLTIHTSAVSNSFARDHSSMAGANVLDHAARVSVAESYGNLPMRFEVNNGQVDSKVRFISRGNGYTLFLTPTEAVLSLRQGSSNQEAGGPHAVANDVIRLKLIGANANPKITGLDELPAKSNYFAGNDPAKWRMDVANYAKTKIENVYSGIDLIYYGNQQQLEYDWVVNPGADPKTIRFAVEGKANLKVDSQGNLILDKKGKLRLKKPFIYQVRAGSRVEISGQYVLLGKREAGFQLSRYDASLPLVIDPILTYSTYLGGSLLDTAYGIAVDSSSNAYVAGYSTSTNFPIARPYQTSYGGGSYDVIIAKLNPSGGLLYSTYIGGSGDDHGLKIALDASGNIYVTGDTNSTNFPTANPYQASSGGSIDAFLLKLNSSGNALIYSTYLGGSGDDHSYGIAVDSSGSAYITGYTSSTNFPLVGALQATFGGSDDVFITKFNALGSGLVYSTYLGGSGSDRAHGIALDSSGNASVIGDTASTNFPTANSYQSSYGGGTYDAFVARLNAAGNNVFYSTYLGGSDYDYGYGIEADSSGNTYVTGYTASTNFPAISAYQPTSGGSSDAFVTKLNASGNPIYSTFLGGSAFDRGNELAVDASGNVYVTGYTASTNFPMKNPYQASFHGVYDVFVTKLDSSGGSLLYSTYLGGSALDQALGIALDSNANAYVIGHAASTDFPTIHAYQSTLGGGYDVFVARFGLPVYSGLTIGDVDGDGKADFGVFRPSSGFWYMLPSGTPGTYTSVLWGLNTDIAVAGDYDGDGRMDYAVWRPSSGIWYILPSDSPGTYLGIGWGMDGDYPVPADYDGDGKTDIAVWRSSNGVYYTLSSKSPGTYTSTQWGMAGDVPTVIRKQP
jgi:hypothetical protein